MTPFAGLICMSDCMGAILCFVRLGFVSLYLLGMRSIAAVDVTDAAMSPQISFPGKWRVEATYFAGFGSEGRG
jgi:hypothetical protein